MFYSPQGMTSLRPDMTPKVIQRLIIATCLISIVSALCNQAIAFYFHIPSPLELLGLSFNGFSHFYFWQLISYLFIQPAFQGIDLSFITALLFDMVLLWITGSLLHERLGNKEFLKFYLSAGAFAALISLATMWLSSRDTYIAGPAPAIYALLAAVAVLYPEWEVWLFLLFPIKIKWLVVALLTIVTLISLSQRDLFLFVTLFSGTFYGYLYSLRRFEQKEFFFFLKNKLLSKFGRSPQSMTSSKIYDLNTGEKLISDELFVDAMLAKISKHGEQSLSRKEKQRLQKISLEKAKKENHRF